MRKKKEREEAAQLKKTKQEEAGKKAQEVEAAKKAKEKEVVPTPSAEETESEVPKVRRPEAPTKELRGTDKNYIPRSGNGGLVIWSLSDQARLRGL